MTLYANLHIILSLSVYRKCYNETSMDLSRKQCTFSCISIKCSMSQHINNALHDCLSKCADRASEILLNVVTESSRWQKFVTSVCKGGGSKFVFGGHWVDSVHSHTTSH